MQTGKLIRRQKNPTFKIYVHVDVYDIQYSKAKIISFNYVIIIRLPSKLVTPPKFSSMLHPLRHAPSKLTLGM